MDVTNLSVTLLHDYLMLTRFTKMPSHLLRVKLSGISVHPCSKTAHGMRNLFAAHE